MKIKKTNPQSGNKYSMIVFSLLLLQMGIYFPDQLEGEKSNKALKTKSEYSKVDQSSASKTCKSLLKAVKQQNVEKVKELLKTKDPDCVYNGDREPRSPLVAAARLGNLEIIQLLIASGAAIEFHAKGDESPLMAASAYGHLLAVQLLIENGAEINRKLQNEGTALIFAARQGHIETVRWLIQQGADVNEQVELEGTPLIVAVRGEHFDVVKELLENGADPSLSSPMDETPMLHAMESNNKALIELIKQYEEK